MKTHKLKKPIAISIRKEIAGALGVAESNPAVFDTYQRLVAQQNEKRDEQCMSDAQKIIDDTRTYGRRIETTSLELPGLTRMIQTRGKSPLICR